MDMCNGCNMGNILLKEHVKIDYNQLDDVNEKNRINGRL